MKDTARQQASGRLPIITLLYGYCGLDFRACLAATPLWARQRAEEELGIWERRREFTGEMLVASVLGPVHPGYVARARRPGPACRQQNCVVLLGLARRRRSGRLVSWGT